MTVNEGKFDRIIRIIIGAHLIALAYFYFEGTWAVVAAVIGAIALLTGIVGICPAYSIFGLRTCPLRPAK